MQVGLCGHGTKDGKPCQGRHEVGLPLQDVAVMRRGLGSFSPPLAGGRKVRLCWGVPRAKAQRRCKLLDGFVVMAQTEQILAQGEPRVRTCPA